MSNHPSLLPAWDDAEGVRRASERLGDRRVRWRRAAREEHQHRFAGLVLWQLTGTGVNVTAVLPGWTRTEFHSRGGPGRKGVPGFLWLDADRVTEVALADARAGHVISIPSKRYKVAAAVLQLLPNAAVRALSCRIKGKTKTPSEGGAPQ